MSIQQFPSELLGHIACQMLLTVGPKKPINQADVPVLLKYLANLSLVNRYFKKAIDDETVSLIQILSKKYKYLPLDVATLMDSAVSRRWLWDQFQKNGTWKTFQTIQKIFNLTETILQTASCGDSAWPISPGNIRRPDPDFSMRSNTQALSIRRQSDQLYLLSPFGEHALIDNPLRLKEPLDNLYSQLKQQLGIEQNEDRQIITRIADKPIGALPEIYLKDLSFQSTVSSAWAMCQRFKKEQNPYSRLSPSSRQTRHAEPNFRDVRQLLEWIDLMVDRLKQQPVQEYSTPFLGTCRFQTLQMPTKNQARIFTLIQPDKTNPIRLGSEPYEDVLHAGIYINLPYFDPTINSLKEAARALLQTLSFNDQNWKAAKYAEYEEYISNLQSEETHSLFISKKNFRFGFRDFFSLISSEMGLSESCSCHSMPRFHGSAHYDVPLYLWVKKEDLHKLLQAFAPL